MRMSSLWGLASIVAIPLQCDNGGSYHEACRGDKKGDKKK